MKSIRRSLNKDKDKDRNSSNSNGPASPPLPGSFRGPAQPIAQQNLGSKSAAPPKAVIRALQSYKSRSPVELSFEKGDFFHVLSERYASQSQGRDEEDWFDAHNPLTNARGLVPMDCFEVLGRNAKSSAVRSPPASAGNSPTMGSSSTFGQQNGPSPPPSKGGAGGKGQSLYGIVQFDFQAQRQDELDAKKGEPIVVIAQSNHEWFVAKPIGRLGGPGLIPVSYVSIMNMATGKALDAQVVQEMIQGGALPPVEEWKKTTAEYKQNSIPLGKFDFAQQQQQEKAQAANGSLSRSNTSPNQQSLHGRQGSQGRQVNSHYDVSNNQFNYQQQSSYSSPALGQNASQTSLGQDPRYSSHSYDQQSEHNEEEDALQRYGLVVSASVESFHQEEGSFWFHVRCAFTSRCSLVLYRLYDDFYDFQIALMDVFRVEAGRELPPDARPGEKPRRTLPKMPGPVADVDEVVCAQRVADLSVYLSQLCQLPEHIRSHSLFYDFLIPRPGDVEVAPPQQMEDDSFDVGRTAAENEIVELLGRMPGSSGGTPEPDLARQMEQTRLSGSGGERTSSRVNSGYGYNDPRPESSTSNRSGPSRMSHRSQNSGFGGMSPAASTSHRPPSHQQSNEPAQGHSRGMSASGSATGARTNQPPFIKIKIFHRNTDDLIAIRVPPTVTRDALLDKVRERLGGNVSSLRYKEEVSGGQAKLVELYNDDDLDYWLNSGGKLSLFAD